MKILKLFILFALSCFSAGCTKEIPEPEPTINDLTGYWNGYYYTDMDGWVPLELIRIDKKENDSLIATKIIGDKAVLSGMVTWRGRYTGSTFQVLITAGNGKTFNTTTTTMTVKSAVLLECGFGPRYIRRSDEYHP